MGSVNLTVLSIIIGYLVLVTLIGLWASRKVKNVSDYLIGGGRMGFVLVAMTLAGSWEGTGTSIGVSQAAYTQGIYTGFYASFFAAGLILTIFTLLKFVRFSISLTPAEMLGKMFGTNTRVLTAISVVIPNMVVMATQLVGGAGIMSAVLGIPFLWGLMAMVATTGLYSVLGGIVSNAWVNVCHAVIQNVMALAAIPVVLIWIGGWDTLVASMPAKFFSVEGIGFSNLTAWWWTLGLGVMVMSFQQIQQAASNREAEKGFWLAAALCAVYSMPFAVLGVAAASKFPGVPALQAMPMLAMAIDPLFAGLLLASVIAAALSTLGVSMSLLPLFVVNDIYRIAKPHANDREQLVVARISMVVIIAVAIAIAATAQQIIVMNIFAFTFRSVVLLVIVGGLLLASRRLITAEGAFTGIFCAVVGIFVSQFGLPDQPPVYLTVLFLVLGTAIGSIATHGRGHFCRSAWEILFGAKPQVPKPKETKPEAEIV